MTPMQESTPWPLTVKVGSGFLLRSAIIAVMCLVLGVWGIYDYLVAIPTQELQYHRAEVARQFNRIAEPLLAASGPHNTTDQVNDEALTSLANAIIADLRIEPMPGLADEVNGLQAVSKDGTGNSLSLSELRRLLVKNLNAAGAPSTPAEKVTANWLGAVGGMTVVAMSPVALGGEPVPELKLMGVAANSALSIWGDVQPPSKFDRPMQWMFILCLPFVPWYAWSALAAKRRTYVLDKDGTLHVPGGTWAKDDIADIDMSLWMRKSKASVVHVDGTRAVLDDYVYKGLHRIIGALASDRYPEQWTLEAKRVKAETPASANDDTPDTAKVLPDARGGDKTVD